MKIKTTQNFLAIQNILILPVQATWSDYLSQFPPTKYDWLCMIEISLSLTKTQNGDIWVLIADKWKTKNKISNF